MHKKLKSWLADDALFIALLVILVGVVSFGLGRLSVSKQPAVQPSAQQQAGVIFTAVPAPDNSIENQPFTTTRVVASRSGTKYYLPECSGVHRIKKENRVFFDSIELAKAAGYTPAANCPGLH